MNGLDDYLDELLMEDETRKLVGSCKRAGYHLGPSQFISSLDRDSMGDEYMCGACEEFYYEVDIRSDKYAVWQDTRFEFAAR